MSVALNLLASLLLVLGIAGETRSEEADWCGRRVRLSVSGQSPLVGVLVDADASALTLEADGDRGRIRLDRASIRDVEVSTGKYPRTLEGLLGGALAWGAIVGAYAAFDTLDESGVGEPLFMGGMVLAGGVVGTLSKKERWDRVAADRVRISIRPWRRGAQVQVAVRF